MNNMDISSVKDSDLIMDEPFYIDLSSIDNASSMCIPEKIKYEDTSAYNPTNLIEAIISLINSENFYKYIPEPILLHSTIYKLGKSRGYINPDDTINWEKLHFDTSGNNSY